MCQTHSWVLKVSACCLYFVGYQGMWSRWTIGISHNESNLRFFGLIGVYFSLQYLSLSDATVLTFLSPLCTAASGAMFLGEIFSRKELFAGCAYL